MSKFSKLKTHDLLKTILMFFFYFAYVNLASFICQIFGISYDLTVALYADCIFMLVIVFVYQKNIKRDLEYTKKNYTIKKLFKTVLITSAIIIFIYLFFNFIVGLFFTSEVTIDDNAKKIVDLYNISSFYTIFKTMVFGIIAEELLYREAVRDVIDKKWLFIIISAFIYTAMNYIYTDFTSNTLIADIIIIYFLRGILFSTAYIKNNSNIVILMLVKFVYNLIPLTLLLLGL